MCSGGMTSLLRSRHLRIAGMAVGAVAVAGAAVVVTASAAGMSFGLRQPSQPPSTIGHAGTKTDIAAYTQQYLTAAATALGLSETQLKTDLAGGQSLSQVAAAQHVSEADFRTRLVTNLKPALDAAVTNKKLTSQ